MGLGHGEDRCEAGIGPFHEVRPRVAGAAPEGLRDLCAYRRILARIHLAAELDVR